MMLNSGPLPLYYQLKNIIKAKIESTDFKSNGRLPSEEELCSEYNISRATVRQALLELEHEGYIYRMRGKGTFVTDHESRKQLSYKGTIENLITSARGTHLEILEIKKVVPPSRVAETLGLVENQKCQSVKAVRSSPKGPFAYANLFFPLKWAELISLNEYTVNRELLLYIEEKIKNQIHWANQAVSVELTGKIVAKYLSLKPTDPVLVIQRDYYLQDGSPLFVAITHNRPDRYEYKVYLTRT